MCSYQASSPACTELETIVMDWLGKMIGLPDEFLHTKPHSPGGGVIQVILSQKLSFLHQLTQNLTSHNT